MYCFFFKLRLVHFYILEDHGLSCDVLSVVNKPFKKFLLVSDKFSCL